MPGEGLALRVATPPSPAKFGVYENASITSALSRQTIRRKPWHFPVVLMMCCASVSAAWILQSRAEELTALTHSVGMTHSIACTFIQIAQWSMTVFVLMTISALFKVINLQASPDMSLTSSFRAERKNVGNTAISGSPSSTPFLPPEGTSRKWFEGKSQIESPLSWQRPPRALQCPGQTSPLLVPIHPQLTMSKNSKLPASQWNGRSVLGSPISNSPGQTKPATSPAPAGSPCQCTSYPAPPQAANPTPPQGTNPAPPQAATPVSQGSTASTVPWSRDRIRSGRLEFGKDEIDSEKKLAEFLAEVDSKLAEGSVRPGGLATPPPAVQGVASGPNPSPAATPVSVSSTPRSAVRALRMSPTAPKTGSPKKGEVELPIPMTMEQAAEVLKKLDIYPQMDDWRDRLRQWFSDFLLNPLVRKIDSSNLQTMAAAAKLGLVVSVSQVGSSQYDGGLTSNSSDGSQQEWLTTMAPDEDAFLHQLRSALLQARDGPIREYLNRFFANPKRQQCLAALVQELNPLDNLCFLHAVAALGFKVIHATQYSLFGFSPPQERVYNPHVQACLDAVTEHQRLKALMKGEWVKGLLPQSSVRSDYTVQRIRDLAEGTCVKAYESWLKGEVYDKTSKRWTSELPSDAHLLLYLFCSLLEHPQWMLHIDPASYPSTQSSNNSLFIAGLPQKERYPEKYIAILLGAPPVLHAGATVLAIGKPNPPVFALYWDKKLQYSCQGRSALWDAILLLCYRVKVAHGGVVRGINLGSPAFNLLSVLDACLESPAR